MIEIESEFVTPVPAKTVAEKMIDAAICAYAITPTGYFPDPFFSDPIGFVAPPYAWTDGVDDINAALLGITDDNWAVLSIRGTLSSHHTWAELFASLHDWLQDDGTSTVPLYDSKFNFLGNIEKGWHEATKALWPYFHSVLQSFDWSKLNGLRITGHSKGAGMCFPFAALAHAEKASMRHGGPKAIEVHAFAAPLAGDPTFVSHYHKAKLDSTTTRYQHAHDIVPFLPPYLSWNVFNNMSLNWHNAVLYGELSALYELIDGGYELTGGLKFYPEHVPGTPWPSPVTGSAGVVKSQAAILAAISAGYSDRIAAAHSAVHSYWPAIFGRDLPSLSLDELTAKYEAKLTESCS